MSNGFVVAMGMGTVFFGLIVLILLCMLMSKICTKLIETKPSVTLVASAAVREDAKPAKKAASAELKAAVAAAVAEEMGTDVSAIRILSFRAV